MSDNYVKDASFVAVVATLALVLWQRAAPPDLTVPGPGSEPVPSHSLPRDPQRIDARLWEDPFAVIARAEAQYREEVRAALPREVAPPSHRTQVGDLRTWITARHPSTAQPPSTGRATARDAVTLIGITRDASSRASRQEARRRDRVALQAAMTRVGASRVDAQHLGGLVHRPRADGPPIVVPFELYERGLGRARESFVVLWLDEDHFFQLPEPPDYCTAGLAAHEELLPAIRDLFGSLVQVNPADRGTSAGRDIVDVRRIVLGPRTSDRLRKLAANALLRKAPKTESKTIEMYAYSASAASEALVGPLLARKDCESAALPARHAGTADQNVEDALLRQRIELTRTIADDERVLDAIGRELEIRARSRVVVPPQSSALTFVTLVSVGDLYAWKLAESFEHRMTTLAGAIAGRGPRATDPPVNHRYEFMRELNDRARSSSGSAEAPAGGDRTPSRVTGDHRASAQDNQQFDYVERLADRIERDMGAAGPAAAPPFAIAIFGADPNDRITLIRAIKRRLPGALFVTTDVDARYLDPGNVAHTRNMLIGSAYGLEPSDATQSRFAPFRDAHQTAFHATLVRALPLPASSPASTADTDKAARTAPDDPSVYEVGLGKFVLLSHGQQTVPPHRPVPWMALIGFAAGSWLVALFAAWVVRSPRLPCSPSCREGREWWRSAERTDLLAVVWLAAFGILIVAWIAWLGGLAALETWGHETAGEPADWNQGVSVWGAVAVRSLGCVLVGVLLCQFVAIYYGEVAGIGRPAPLAGEGWLRPALWKAIRVWRLQAHDRPRHDRNTPEPPQHATGICDRYVLATAPRQTIVIAVVRVVMLALVMEFLLWAGGQPADVARSEASGLLYFWSGRVSAWLLFLLLTVSMHIYSECGAWMHRLAGSEAALCRVTWSPEHRGRMVNACRLTHPAPDGQCLDRLLDAAISLERIRDHTEIIGRFIYAPFIVLGVLLVSTWQGFEYFQWPVGAQILLAIVVAVAVINAVALELVATRVKRNITAMVDHELPLLLAPLAEDAPLRRQLEPLAADLRNVDEGAFAPMLRQPVVRALTFPGFAGVALTLIDLFLAT